MRAKLITGSVDKYLHGTTIEDNRISRAIGYPRRISSSEISREISIVSLVKFLVKSLVYLVYL